MYTTIESFKNHNNGYADILIKLGIHNFRLLDVGLHGAVYLLDNNKVIKLTKSEHEKDIVKMIYGKKFESLPYIYELGENNNVFWYIRDYYDLISDDLVELIEQEMDEIYQFFEQKTMDVTKSNTNLTEIFDNDFISFLSQLKKDLNELKLLPFNWDISGFSLNVLQHNNKYILADF